MSKLIINLPEDFVEIRLKHGALHLGGPGVPFLNVIAGDEYDIELRLA